VEEKIDELRDLDVVDGDFGFALVCDDKIALFRLKVDLNFPGGHPINSGPGKDRPFQIGVDHLNAHKVGAPEVRTG
jgi:hypothetical protein